MSLSDLQQRIDAVPWYHEFSFPNGLRATPTGPDLAEHREFWQFIEVQLDRIDMEGKTVLDIGCWDGFWSFYAERRGAKHVLATDDRTQNWAGSAGLLLARELLNSKIETRLDVSIYDLSGLGRFDVILCMGVWYHLVDAFHAFAQVRQCCHRDSIVVFEGDILYGWPPQMMHYDLSDLRKSAFLPGIGALRQMWNATYFEVVSEKSLIETRKSAAVVAHDASQKAAAPASRRGWFPGKWKRNRESVEQEPSAVANLPPLWSDRLVAVCRPVWLANNPLHFYRPPFGLHAFDDRFRGG
jgi:tRNA (mo5U34)-methyltransferase